MKRRALLAALESAEPPVRLVLGPEGLEVADLHDGRRRDSRDAALRLRALAGRAGSRTDPDHGLAPIKRIEDRSSNRRVADSTCGGVYDTL